MGHDHAHDHALEVGRRSQLRLAVVLGLTMVYMVAEVVGGVLSNSLALLADAGHMFSDVAALGLSLFAVWLSRRPPTARRTYGYHRTPILAALFNGATLIAVALFILVEAWERMQDPPPVKGPLMLAVACGGLAVNLIGLWVLRRGKSLNERGAWLHVLTDALGSVGAIVSGGLIWGLGWTWSDPAVSCLIALLVVYSSVALLRETVAILMESAPAHLDVDEVREAMAHAPSVTSVHDLHVWTITSGMDCLSGHVVTEPAADHRQVLSALQTLLRERFGIKHLTIQIELDDPDPEAEPCPTSEKCV